MTAIWHSSDGKWGELQPVGFPDEAALHDLVEKSPEMLPLSGSPKLAVLGREVRLGGGSADLIAMETDGRIAVIEIKLRTNPEARRAVVAQVLGYASWVYRMSPDDLEATLLPHLQRDGYRTLADAVGEKTQTAVDPLALRNGIAVNLASGEFRLVLVLDEVPQELESIVSYLEAVAQGVIVDLVKVSAYQVGNDRIMVPQRVEPERLPYPSATRGHSTSEEAPTAPGVDGFIEAAMNVAPDERARLNQLAAWASELADSGLARIATTFGKTRRTISVRVRGTDSGLVTVATDNGGSLWLWRSVFERRAPGALQAVDKWYGEVHKSLPAIRSEQITDELLSILRAAYVEAQSTS